tara:strand:+ start:941 stop:1804 length:864 start_codon:yes stop_codon:yes gene_type:complete
MATLDEIRAQYYGDLAKSGQELITGLPPLPKQTVEGISGAEQQALDLARQSVAQRPDYLSMGVGSLGQASLTAADAAQQAAGATGQFDPTSTQAFMNPYQQQVIDEYTKEMQRQFDISRQGRSAQAIGAGAFGGGREGVLEAEAMTGFQRQLGQGLAGLMSSGYQQAQQAAQQAFENQQRRGQLAAQNLGNIGRLQTGIGQMFGQFAPVASGVAERDVSTLARIGATERGIGQAQRTADYQNLLRSYQQPFTAMEFQSGILGGFPTFAQSAQAQAYNPLLTGIQSLF